MHFTKACTPLTPTSINITTLKIKCIGKVIAYKYRDLDWMDTFKVHFENLE